VSRIYIILFFISSCLIGTTAKGQGQSINTNGALASPSAILDVTSTSQGVLIPRMTTAQRNAISSPATGLMIFQTDSTAGFYYYNGTAWSAVGGGSSLPSGITGDLLYYNGSAWVSLGIGSIGEILIVSGVCPVGHLFCSLPLRLRAPAV
jgi:hypothetical protein